MIKLDSSRVKRYFNTLKSVNVIHHINKRQDKTMIISIDGEASEKDSTLHNKNSYQCGDRENIFQIIKAIYRNLQPTYTQWWKSWKPSNWLGKTECPLSLLLLSIVFEVLATADKQEIKGIQNWKEEVKLSWYTDDMILNSKAFTHKNY